MGKNHSGELEDRIEWTKTFIKSYRSRRGTNLTSEDVKRIYGNKGGLRICAGLQRGKPRSEFLCMANFITTNYQKLKIEFLAKAVNVDQGQLIKRINLDQLDEYSKQALQKYADALVAAKDDPEQLKKYLNEIKTVQNDLWDLQSGQMSELDFMEKYKKYGKHDIKLVNYWVTINLEETRKKALDCEQHLSAKSSAENAALDHRHDYNKLIKDCRQGYNQLIKDFNLYRKNLKSLDDFRKACAKKATDYLKNNKFKIYRISKGKYKDSEPCPKVYRIFFAGLVALVGPEQEYYDFGRDTLDKILKVV